MQERLRSSKHDASGYLTLTLSLQDEMQLRLDQISDLHDLVASYKSENDSVKQKIEIKEVEASTARQDLAAKEKQLLGLDAKIRSISQKLRNLQADAYYARARQVEETAGRMKLAPQKKRAAYEEAVELYKMALSFGKEEAKLDINKLNERLQ